MKPLLLLTRPRPALEATARAARRAGFATLSAPLQTIIPLAWEPVGPVPDALLFTSAQAPPLVSRHAMLRALPVWAVGPRTAVAARRAGFPVVGIGRSDGSAIVAQAAAAGARRLWHMGGADRAPLSLPPGLTLVHHPVYAAQLASALPPRAVQALRSGRVLATLLFSARAAARFAALVDAAGLRRDRQRLVALSAAVAGGAGSGWAAVAIADRPATDAAFAAAGRLWQEVSA